jgi:hypothetical protein
LKNESAEKIDAVETTKDTLTVDAENFSIYAIIISDLQNTITVIYHANGSDADV